MNPASQSKRSAQQRAWRKRHNSEVTVRRRQWRRTHRDKARILARVYKALYRATVAGIIVRPKACTKCGREARLHAHHEHYGRPLDVVFLCVPCHLLAHQTEEPVRWPD